MTSSKFLLRTPVYALLICGLALGSGAAQQNPPAAKSTTNNDSSGANLPIQKMGPDDLVSIQVYDSPELTRTERISQDGMLRLPMLTKAVKAGGLYPADLEKAISDELKAEQILIRPIVSVSVSEYRSRPINVVGAVHHPLTFQAFGNVTLLDAMTRAEGLSTDAGTEILVTHPGQEGGEGLVQRIPVKGLIDGADPALNLHLHGGEEIRVPEASKIFVVGNVKRPGAFPVHDNTESSVLRMIAMAEGLLPYAGKEAFILRHGDASKGEISIPLQKIIDRKSPDIPLLGNDVLYIPDNKGARMTANTMRTLLALGGGTVSGLLIYRH